MTEIMRNLYYMVDTWAGQQYEMDEETKGLEEEKLALENEIARRLGDGGEDMVEALSGLNLKLEDIHDKAVFRAAMQLGAEIAQPRICL